MVSYADRKSTQSHSRPTGFTLIELLVVVAIIALLMSIVLPTLGQSRERAKATVCAANLHQVGLALHMYIQQYGYYPGHHTERTPSHVHLIAWPPRLRRFTANVTKVFDCPSNDPVFRWIPKYRKLGVSYGYGYDPGEYPLTYQSGFSYGYNDWGVREFTNPHLGLGGHVDDTQYPWTAELHAERVRVPSDMIALADSKSDNNWDTAIDPADYTDEEWPSTRHRRGSEVLFADAHVTWMSQRVLVEPTEWSRRRWNNDHLPHKEYW